MLSVEDIVVSYGDILAVRGVSIEVGSGQIVAVLGANGAGKSTLVKAIVGLVRPRSGVVHFADREVTGRRPFRLVREGMTLVPEGRGTIAPLTVEENLLLAARGVRGTRARHRGALESYELFPVLGERRHVKAGLLSGGEQQMLAFGRALATRPRLLLLDEPSTGLSPTAIEIVMDAVSTIRERDIAVLVVEQNVAAALDIADYAYVLDQGCVVQQGNAETLAQTASIKEAFLGI